MTSDTLRARLQAIPISDLIEQARPALQRLIEGKGRLCIPAQPYDDDMVLSEVLDRLDDHSRRIKILRDHAATAKQDCQRYYAVRWEHLRDLLRGTDLEHAACNIMANGAPLGAKGGHPRYDLILNILQHENEKLKEENAALKAELGRP